MKLSFVIPVYNVQATIRELYECVKAVDIENEIVIADDGSADGSREIFRGLAADIIAKSVHQSRIDRFTCIGQ